MDKFEKILADINPAVVKADAARAVTLLQELGQVVDLLGPIVPAGVKSALADVEHILGLVAQL